MSACKWGKLYQLAVMHNVTEYIYEGLQLNKEQFFLHMTDSQWKQWEKTIREVRKKTSNDNEEDEFLRADHLTNPLLNRKLQTILDDENSDTYTRQLLLTIIRCARHILNEGVPVRQLVDMGVYLSNEGHHVDFITLEKWLKSLKLHQVAKLEGSLLMELLGFSHDVIPFVGDKTDRMSNKWLRNSLNSPTHVPLTSISPRLTTTSLCIQITEVPCSGIYAVLHDTSVISLLRR